MTSHNSPSELIRSAGLEAGACAVGFAEALPTGPESARLYAEWLEQGRHASMAYLEKYQELRSDPATLLEGARTVVSLAFSYRLPHGAPRHPLFADYALGEDYHDVLRRRLEPVCALISKLFPGAATRVCVDTAPIHERLWAVRAGLGFIGRNSMLIVPSRGAGSRVFLAEIITTALLPPDVPLSFATHPCGDCRLCLDACPGGALDCDGAFDARRCYSYHTIENRDTELPAAVNLRGRRIYGCDICQDACPFNRQEYIGPCIPEFAPRPQLTALKKAADVASLDHARYLELFRGSAIRRAKLPQLIRNALRGGASTSPAAPEESE
ncbi:MAG: tRNA epoxyqueuosine(34) reductase QueG [Muribaculaceae bacterium]|nr:tRNA epoxyqueuosine(34) reductase QueG [Muribaculaceae bacterium]